MFSSNIKVPTLSPFKKAVNSRECSILSLQGRHQTFGQALGAGITAAENKPENNTWAQAKTGREFFVDTVLYRKLYTQIQINAFPLLLASTTSCFNPCCLPSSSAHQKNGNRNTTTMTAGADLVMTSNCRIFRRSCSVYKHNSEKYLSIVWFQFSASVTGFYLCADIGPGASETGYLLSLASSRCNQASQARSKIVRPVSMSNWKPSQSSQCAKATSLNELTLHQHVLTALLSKLENDVSAIWTVISFHICHWKKER